ncbi:MAG: hypothetical protein Q9160_003250 [Pyrenula sp. 1 TL-2023]
MVSHPDYSDGANEFPVFAHTGDVEIVISAGGQEKRYLLHRLILAQCSGFFEAGTSEEWSRGQAQQAARPIQEMGLARIGEEVEGPSSPPSITSPISIEAMNRRPAPQSRWRYELDWENTEEDEEPLLVQKTPSTGTIFGGDFSPVAPPPPRSKPPPPQSGGFFRSMANLTLNSNATTTNLPPPPPADAPPTNELIRDYDNLFRIFYNYAPRLNSTNIAAAYSESKTLLNLADMYDALVVVGPRIDHHLLRFSSRLFKQIAKYPPSYLRLAYLARSRIIFTEALIHVVGQWPSALPHLSNSNHDIPDAVLDLIEDKVDELDEAKSKIEARLFRLTLTTSRGERVSPSNAYLDWLAVSLFRQWLAENLTPPPPPITKTGPPPGSSSSNNNNNNNARMPTNPNPHHQGQPHQHPPPPSRPSPPPTPNTGRVYRLLGSPSTSTSTSYLPHSELKRFLKLHPAESLYSRDNLRRFERKIDEIKALAREIVRPLMRNHLELDLSGGAGAGGAVAGNAGGGAGGGGATGGLPYLTCVKVEEEELPWD